MKLTPLDVRKQTFRKTMRGFDHEEVHVFLEMVADEYHKAFCLRSTVRQRNSVIEHLEDIRDLATDDKTAALVWLVSRLLGVHEKESRAL